MHHILFNKNSTPCLHSLIDRIMWTCFYDLATMSNVPNYCLYYFGSLRRGYYCFLLSPNIWHCAIASKSFIYQDAHYFSLFGFLCVCVHVCMCLHVVAIHTSCSFSILAADILSLPGRNMNISFKSQPSDLSIVQCNI